MRWIAGLSLLLIIFACQSKPSKPRGPDSAKVTPTAESNIVELETVVAYAPRRTQEIESSVMLHGGVQSCLRGSPEIRESSFSIGIEANLGYTGSAKDVRVAHPSEALKKCLEKEIPAISFGRGRSGPFKMQISRPQTTGKKSKTLILDLSEGKKWQ
jgi:hypothetical protein